MKEQILNALKGKFVDNVNIFHYIQLDDLSKTNPDSAPSLSPIFNRKVLDFSNLLKPEENTDYEVLIEKDLNLLEGLNDTARQNTWLSILEKYTSLVPADAPYSDVSYYQKAKFDMAIEHAGGDGNLAYCMFEVTGIYDYLFNVGKTEDDTLKLMRGRSYICLVISRAVIFYILHKYNLPKCNVLDDGGELFGILIPRDRIDEIKKDVSMIKKSLIKQFNGVINLLFTIKESVTKKELLDESTQLMTDLTEGLYENEFHLFDDITEMLDDRTFKITSAKTCRYCGRDYSKAEGDKCLMCSKEIEVGKDLPRADYLISYIGKHKDSDIEFFDTVGFKFCNDENEVRSFISSGNFQYIDIAKINSTKFIKDIKPQPNISYSFMTIGNASPMKDKNKIMSFDELEELATGAKYLSAMKIDADNFGKITSTNGFGNKTSLLRIATLSAYFKYFFQGYLTNIIEDHCGYTVYCGGDDLFLIAPWDKMITLALEINKCFHDFTGGNQ
ncbi:MAG: type III-A CRISPR-associated protein Cas10/Csm1, partial [Thermodesulfovibrionales bacterium]|nr:type III-A CRISPR-associated protein Cas10/Csm1 [Thermodesulfovibrionales bacterium]